jgi:hypothetical protein
MTRWKRKRMLKKIMKIYNLGLYYVWKDKEADLIKELIEDGYIRKEAFCPIMEKL